MLHKFLIAIHGSAITSKTPGDIDVIVGWSVKEDAEALAHVEKVARLWAAGRGLPADLPLDIQAAGYIPQLPHCEAPAYEVLQGELTKGKECQVQWDLAAWIRACDVKEKACNEFPFALQTPLSIQGSVLPQFRGVPSKSSSDVVMFTIGNKAGRFAGAYTGGGRDAVENAIAKCKNGWIVVSQNLPADTIDLVRGTPGRSRRSFAALMMEAFIEHGAPSGSGECLLTSAGVVTAHQGMRTWQQIEDHIKAACLIRKSLLPGERSILGDFLAYEKAELRAKAGLIDSIADMLSDLHHKGIGWSPNANELRRRLRSLYDALPKSMRLNMEAIPLGELLQPPTEMAKVTLLNTSIMTSPGVHSLRRITVEEARCVLAEAQQIESAVGHEATAQVMTELLGRTIAVNRQFYVSKPGSVAIVFKLKGRPPEGKVLTREEMEAYGYEIFLQIHQRDLQA